MGVRVVFPDMGKDPSVQLIEKTITENGTYDAITDGANGYSKVNVNVEGGGGSSDFSTANVTIVNNTDITRDIEMSILTTLVTRPASYGFAQVVDGDNTTVTAILYKNLCACRILGGGTITVTGNATVMTPTLVAISGDCTITIS